MSHESTRTGRGMVATPHHLATQAGKQILSEGGNAVEAALAAAAAIAVVYPHMNHLGGDGFWLIREPSGRVRYIEACGFAGAKATIAHYRDLGHDTIPFRGPLAALTVPGAVGGWALAHEAARAFGGKLGLAEILEPAIRHARAGVPVSRSQVELTASRRAELEPSPGFARTFLPGGKVPELGQVLVQPGLAQTLEHLVGAGLDDFYRGDVGREIAGDLERIGSPVTRGDLERYRAVTRAPLQVKLKAGTVYNAPPPTQGLASLIILGLFDRLNVRAPEGFDHVHGLVEATKRAFLVRDTVVRDHDLLAEDVTRYLDPAFLDPEAARIDTKRALPWPQPAAHGDTIWLGAADASGLAVSYIQSIYFEFGSGCVLPATGVLMQNRGASFSLNAKAVNPLTPGRRPFHTLNPALADLADGRIMAYGTMGGEGQPQTQAAVFTRHVLFREPLGEAIAAPRWLLGRTWGSTHNNLRLENRFDESLVRALVSAGHDLEVLPEAFSDTMGHAGAVILHPKGGLEGAHDPRADGGAAGI
ncbi:gamma-glutamyltransferase family protein [Aquabacter sediminis]|uniref:gamma-glutamyltransferase family protein n=1 Tax=Aquabacter sediminis TaxID=3029197 RepID=UPI00237DCEBF|nr:gamma-glutamyltransferase family protein [Aquabacter sp. P-9]MDE1568673.1 gamma-glutamyltransferase family protein [Aquabacter sp. P-9]